MFFISNTLRLVLAVVLGVFAPSFNSAALQIEQYPPLVELVEQMVVEDAFSRQDLVAILESVEIDEKTLSLMGRQYEAKPWHEYKKIFINNNRINQGARFYVTHQELLDKAYQQYGVPAEIITAIIGIETNYGRNTGGKKVLDSLVTLSAAYPRRSKFFTKELRFFLNLMKAENIDPKSVKGSFAGAMGIPQFMPSSYTSYAVDFNGDGKRDLINEVADAIGSVANYLHIHGWQREQNIYADLTSAITDSAQSLVTKRAKPVHTVDALLSTGVRFNAHKASDKVSLFKLKEKNGMRYVVGYRNFYAITRYNISNNYAMVVSNLASAIHDKVQ